MITDHIPYPPSAGTAIRNFNLLKRLAKDHEVWVLAFTRAEDGSEGIKHLLKFCHRVETVSHPPSGALDKPLEAFKYFLKGYPIELRHYHSQELVEKINYLTSTVAFDVVDVIDSFMGLCLDALPPELHRRTTLTFIDIVFSKYARISGLEPKLLRKFRTWLFSRMMQVWEPKYAERFGRCITVSDSDRHLLRSSNPRLQVDVVPNGVDAKLCQLLPYANPRPSLLFVGNMGYRPNIDAVLYFYHEIYPAIKTVVPDVELFITGLDPSQEIQDLASADVHVTGSVDSTLPYYEQSAVCIVPLRAGGGTRLKILEAMAYGRPVVSTSIGCEGLDVVDGEHFFVVDIFDEFSERVLSLLRDENIRGQMIEKARELVVNRYDWDVITEQLLQIYSSLSDNNLAA